MLAPQHHLIALATTISLTSVPATAGTIFVSPDGSGDAATIQAAIDKALPGDVILLGDGTFTGEGNRDLNTAGKALTLASQSGDPASCIIDCEGSETEPHRGLVIQSGETNATRIESITIRSGWATDGGAIRIEDASPVVFGCRLEGNVAGSDGGGLYASNAPAIVLDACVIESNVAGSSGGGIYLGGDGGHIEASLIRGNSARTDGGVAVSAVDVDVVDTIITGNYASDHSGGLGIHSGDASLIGCTVAGNQAKESAGGIGVFFIVSQLYLERSVVWGNCSAEAADIDVHVENTVRIDCSNTGEIDGDGTVIEIAHAVSQDPFFCDPRPCGDAPTVDGDYRVDVVSVCLPENSPCGARIGSLGEGCEGASPTEQVSWGALKERW